MKGKIVTKEDLQFIVDNWATMDVEEIGKKIGLSKHTVGSHAYTLRKLGVNVPKKGKNGSVKQALIEFANEWKQNNKK